MERTVISLYAAITPNPNVIKFIADRYILDDKDKSADFRSREQAVGYSPLAVALFDEYQFVTGVFIAQNFISITKDSTEIAWDYLQSEVRNFLWNYIVEGNPLITLFPEEKVDTTLEYAPSPFDDKIIKLMDQFVKAPVQGDGGEIVFRNFKDGVVTVLLKGACVGCPARNKTLKQGIEDILMKYIPEVTEVVAENGDEESTNKAAVALKKSPFDTLDFSEFDSLPEIS